jgi:hypothetical protein
MNLQLLSDRFEIRALVVAYSNALDARAFARLDQIFTPDAYIDYRATGGIDGRYPQIRAWLPAAVTAFPHMCHLVGNIEIRSSAHTAQARTLCLNPVCVALPTGGEQVMFLAMWYADQLVRTEAGWRMTERVQQGSIRHNVPPHLQIPLAPAS